MLLSPIRCCDVTIPPPCSVVNYVLHPCTLIACKCTPSVVSASLCSEHVILTQSATVVGEVTSPSRDTMCHFCAPVVYTIDNVTEPRDYNHAGCGEGSIYSQPQLYEQLGLLAMFIPAKYRYSFYNRLSQPQRILYYISIIYQLSISLSIQCNAKLVL